MIKFRLSGRISTALSNLGGLGAVLANVGSIGAIGLAGIALNFLVARIYGLEGLGVFSQALTLFLVFGQVCAGGFAFSTLHRFSTTGARDPEARSFLAAMCLPVAFLGGSLALVLIVFGEFIGSIIDSERVAATIPVVSVAVILIALNKIGGMALNGMGHLKSFALMQAARMPLMLAAFLVLVFFGRPVTDIGWIFLTSELLLFLAIFGMLLGYTERASFGFARAVALFRQESGRGWRGFFIGLLADVNTKIDIMVLSVFVSDTSVGIYALGALLAEGLRMVLAAVQNVVNPRLPRIIETRDQAGLTTIYSTLALYGRAVLAVAILIGAAFIVWIAPLILDVKDTAQSAAIFTLIALSTFVAAPAIVLNQIFSQGGAPLAQTGYYGAIAGFNLMLNLVLVPLFGGLGAAVATGIAEIGQLLLLDRFVSRLYNLRTFA